jgi:glycine betaine/proline transport system substrate-binding protein|tara:strand:+ start:352 stop:1200 length:849 start_codon:yes stop_codon:yes gene_type:complete
MKRIAPLLPILSLVGLLFFQSCEEPRKSIIIGNEAWTLNRGLTYVTKAVLEEKGFKVVIKDERIENIFKQMSAGSIDLYMDAWEDAHYVYIYERQGLEDLGEIYAGCKMGVAVPRYFELDSVSQMKADSSIYGNVFYGVKREAGVMISAITAFRNYEMHPKIMELEEDELLERAQMMVDKEENFVMAAWSPHWMVNHFDLKFLEDTSAYFGETDEIHAYGRSKFEADNPKVAEIIKRISFSEGQMSSLLLEMKDTKNEEEYKKATSKWIADNRGVVNKWLRK